MSLENDQHQVGYQNGAIVFDKFEIVSLIAVGGMGEVYRAKDLMLNNIVALKVLRTDIQNPKAIVRFQSEAKIASKLNHPNIARVIDFGIAGDTAYLSMEFIEGETLQDVLDRVGSLEFPIFLDIFDKISRGLHHAHRAKVIHRDLKPANIAVNFDTAGGSSTSDSGIQVKILDFGIAKNIDAEPSELTRPGAFVGSPLYASPEQSSGGEVGEQSDLYSLSCMMWHCIYGKPPFRGASALETIVMHRDSTLPDIEPEHSYPEEVIGVVRKALSKNPDERGCLETDFLPLFEKFLESDEEETQPASTEASQTVEEKRSLPWALYVVSALFVIGVLVLAFLSFSGSFDERILSEGRKPRQERLSEDRAKPSIFSDLDPGEAIDSKGQYKIRPDKSLEFICERFSTDSSLKKLTNNERITKVSIQESGVTDESIGVFASLVNLRDLDLNSTRLKTLEGFQKIRRLESLNLRSTDITDGALHHLRNLSKLKMLVLNVTAITDEGVNGLGPFPDLESLELDETKIEGTCIPALSRFQKLRMVSFRDTGAQYKQVRELCRRSKTLLTVRLEDCKKISDAERKLLRDEFIVIAFLPEAAKWPVFVKRGQDSEAAGKFGEARKNFEICTEAFQARKGKDAGELAALWNAIARVCLKQKNYREAKAFANKAMNVALVHSEKPSELVSLNLLAEATTGMDGLAKALPYYVRARQLEEEYKLVSLKSLRSNLVDLGDKFMLAGSRSNFQNALKYYEKSFEVSKKTFGEVSAPTALSRARMARAQQGLGNRAECQKYIREADEMVSNASTGSDALRREAAYAYAELAMIMLEFDKEQSLKYNDKALAIIDDSLPHCLKNVLAQRYSMLSGFRPHSAELKTIQKRIQELKKITDHTHDTLIL